MIKVGARWSETNVRELLLGKPYGPTMQVLEPSIFEVKTNHGDLSINLVRYILREILRYEAYFGRKVSRDFAESAYGKQQIFITISGEFFKKYSILKCTEPLLLLGEIVI